MARKKTPCTLPTAPSMDAVRRVALPAPDHQSNEIANYVEWQTNKGADKSFKVIHSERIKAEVVHGTEHVVWDVHTDEPGRWWVITAPTNLYSQNDFPSLDYTLSFHVGVMARVASRDAKRAPSTERDRLRTAWRRWETAAEAIELALEAEDFQSVGMRCREALVSLAKALQSQVPIPDGVEKPKAADFVGWSEHIANHFAGGQRNERIRGYLKSIAREVVGPAISRRPA